MSRIGNQPIALNGATASFKDGVISVKGAKGELQHIVPEAIVVEITDAEIRVKRPNDHRETKAQHGLYRSLINNMVIGVSTGFKKTLLIEGVGYRAALKGKNLGLTLGHSHPIDYQVPEGITFTVPNNTTIEIDGIDKQQVGQVAAIIREFRPPEPYKGKGIRYSDEHIRRKEGKTV
ncbi:MAG TPA: 50S ribosomal protein L6 [Lentisphaeria bacterium]|jgi:large subunit ribosomal protein L6|nr:50S ribosomal protein L6 [Lentisphaeria bacterium]